jgi:hypothetical protein
MVDFVHLMLATEILSVVLLAIFLKSSNYLFKLGLKVGQLDCT